MKSFIWVLFLLLANAIFAQTPVETKYYNNQTEFREVSRRRASVKEEIFIDSLGVTRKVVTDLKAQSILSDSYYIDGKPTGMWSLAIEGTNDYISFAYKNEVNSGYLQYNEAQKSIVGHSEGELEMPVFPYFENEFNGFIRTFLNFPKAARESGIGGRVIAQFIVDANGKVRDISILRGVHPMLDLEVVKVIYQSPDWIPTKVDGEPVAVNVMVSVNFTYQSQLNEQDRNVKIGFGKP